LLPMPEDCESAVAVAPYPDDLEYGAASAIARWTRPGQRSAHPDRPLGPTAKTNAIFSV
jgi:LmbE family N-acetylglucosaminyl deacetylase